MSSNPIHWRTADDSVYTIAGETIMAHGASLQMDAQTINDIRETLGASPLAAGQMIDAILLNAGLIEYDDELETYGTPEMLSEMRFELACEQDYMSENSSRFNYR